MPLRGSEGGGQWNYCGHDEPDFLGITEDGRASAVTTGGNPDCQLILRGRNEWPQLWSSRNMWRGGRGCSAFRKCTGVNYGRLQSCQQWKRPSRQPDVLDDVLGQIQDGADSIHAVMIESHLNGGSQSFPVP